MALVALAGTSQTSQIPYNCGLAERCKDRCGSASAGLQVLKIKQFPASHAYFSGLLVLLIVAAAVVNRGAPESSARVTTDTILEGAAAEISALDRAPRTGAPPATPSSAPASVPGASSRIERVGPGDNLSVVFKRHRIPARELQRILDSGPLAERLTRLLPGEELTFVQDADGALLRFAYAPSSYERLEFQRVDDRYVAREIIDETDVVRVHRETVIERSLFDAGQRIGLDDRVTLQLANIFRWDIDFVLDIRAGDRFHVVYEERQHNGDPVQFGPILAAEFVNQGRRHRAVRYVRSTGDAEYYSPEGDAMRGRFLRAPVDFTRISSHFNLQRRHPLFKRTMPHRGIDYAAPVGTPVLAAGDGTVEVAGRTRANGNYIVLRHGGKFSTKYLHLSRFARKARRGQTVRQGDIIGFVGATGYATGPHLHYEFLVDGAHRNPNTVRLPKDSPIPAPERQRFSETTAPLLALLDRDEASIASL